MQPFKHLLPLHRTASNASRPCLFRLSHTGDLSRALSRPARVYIEAGDMPGIRSRMNALLSGMPHFALSLTTRSAHRHPTSECVAAFLQKRCNIDESKHMVIRTCLQEALINAITHGNLGIAIAQDSRRTFEAFYLAVEDRMAQESLALRRIHITAWHKGAGLLIGVSDEGPGIPPMPEGVQHSLPFHQYSGSGLFFIRSMAKRVWTSDSRRTLFMLFS